MRRPPGRWKRMPVGVRWPVEATALSKGLDATSRPWRSYGAGFPSCNVARGLRVRHESLMSVVWSGTSVALNAVAALSALVAFAVLIVARQRLARAFAPVAAGATRSAAVAALPERFCTLAPAAAESIDAVAVTRQSLLASPPGKHPPLPTPPRSAHGPLPGPDAPDPRTQCIATTTTTPAPNARLRQAFAPTLRA